MDPRYTLLHLLCATAALVVAATMSRPAGHPQARPWLATTWFVLGLAELHVTALCAGLAMRWPELQVFGLLWLLLPVLLWKHFSSRPRNKRQRRAQLHWRHV